VARAPSPAAVDFGCAVTEFRPVCATTTPTPPFFRSFGIKDLGGGSRQVFGFKGLAGKVFKNQRVILSKSAENWFGAASRAVLVDGLETAPIRSLSSRATGLMSMDFEQLRLQRLERAKARGEAALHSPQPSQAWIGGASGGLVCVERTLLSAASDSCPEKREQSRSNRTGPQPDAKRGESFQPSGCAGQAKGPALRFAIGRATRPEKRE